MQLARMPDFPAGITTRQANNPTEYRGSCFFNADRFSRATPVKAENIYTVFDGGIYGHALAA